MPGQSENFLCLQSRFAFFKNNGYAKDGITVVIDVFFYGDIKDACRRKLFLDNAPDGVAKPLKINHDGPPDIYKPYHT